MIKYESVWFISYSINFLYFLQSDTTSAGTKLHVATSERGDSGKYTITATNDFGTDKADIEVIVVDKPGPPGGPLTPSKINGDSITLTWKPPEDDGGTYSTVNCCLFYV
jgi:hypothetical protein